MVFRKDMMVEMAKIIAHKFYEYEEEAVGDDAAAYLFHEDNEGYVEMVLFDYLEALELEDEHELSEEEYCSMLRDIIDEMRVNLLADLGDPPEVRSVRIVEKIMRDSNKFVEPLVKMMTSSDKMVPNQLDISERNVKQCFGGTAPLEEIMQMYHK